MARLLCFFLSVLLLYSAQATAQDQVLLEESNRLRQLVETPEGFAQRMRAYGQLAEPLQGFSELAESAGPLLRDLGALNDELGLFSLLFELDPASSAAKSVLRTLSTLGDGAGGLNQLAKQLALLSADIERLLAENPLGIEELGSLRASLPAGRDAISKTLELYQQFAPYVRQVVDGLGGVQTELLEALLGSDMLGLPPDLAKQLRLFVGGFFEDIKRSVTILDTLSEHAATDLQTLEKLERELREAEAHHAFALALSLIQTGRFDDARAALELLIESFPESPWASLARERLSQAMVAAPAITEDAPAPLELGSNFPWLAVGLLLCAALALGSIVFLLATRNRVPVSQEAQTPPRRPRRR